ncbi:BZ3500_MvSof-1268-A1-R1_Chr12-3g04025 [Microbotryum saponariae]|uniref:BZ3500_MvSof-1268-A1-R1_Chr12-3g04025 protein n=1 Tax=Microbotryum saponariae TaxID=289078 RepID=A0A2X0LBW8_9BASI|nr:BZ3500_MvSof-1268-A1-R1_Chr12-3g04025 [Microbotryum saponariae]SDA02560.1 BZ3501_MvSof-1269-A2-R1_Chr12-3g03680 [Microbotryum saponariae]
MKSLVLLMAIFAASLHVVMAAAVQLPDTNVGTISRRAMNATTDCARSKARVVCSKPAETLLNMEYYLWRQFELSEKLIQQYQIDLQNPWVLTYREHQELYGLWRQGSIGDVNYSRPWWFFNGGKDWDLWNNYKGISCEDARSKYLEVFERAEDKVLGAKLIKQIEAA